ncbi:aminotransferase class I/II-fold pyridoxal phosphate-dependent enzyme [Candidatus Roizmanbacteria bacterium]|nr:aminotransferase class I/II-fold pyridoxal phosphate-dependent enzyme [Candidatus Roizmanbacteria bacterium]
MDIEPFALERYFAKYEFSTKYSLSSSDCDGWAVTDLLKLADSQTKKMWEDLKLGYTESLGLPLLREEVAKLYSGIQADDVLIITPEEGIFIAMQCLLTKGNHVIAVHPGYQSLYVIAESLGAEVTKWQPDEKNNWRFDPAFLEKNIKPNTKLIVMNFPHNPTGSLASKEDYQQIVTIAKKNNVHLFSDEMYRLLEFDPSNRLPSAVELYDKAISLFGMSKTFGMAGARIGWVVTKNKTLYQKMATFKDYTTICSSAPSEILSLIALRAKDTIIQKHLARIKRNLALLDKFFKRYKNIFSWVKPKAGTICFPKLLTNQNSFDFCEEVRKQTGILILPSTVYGYDNNHFRLGFGRENVPEVLKVFEEYVEEK